LEVFSLFLVVLSFMGNKAGWQLLSILGGTASLLTALVLANDAELTSGSVVLASANGNFVSDFNAMTVLAVVIGVAPFIVAARRIFKI
jgi:hypothetical protein